MELLVILVLFLVPGVLIFATVAIAIVAQNRPPRRRRPPGGPGTADGAWSAGYTWTDGGSDPGGSSGGGGGGGGAGGN